MKPPDGVPWVATDADLDRLSWHDCLVHAIALPGEPEHELLIDLDYIVEWVPALPPDPCFRFRVAPATLVFARVTDLALTLDCPGGVSIDRIEREPRAPDPAWPAWQPAPRWTIHAHGGRVAFLATGFTQYLRAAPRLIDTPGSMSLTGDERGSACFVRGRTDT